MSQVATGPIATALGSASLPAFTFRGDLNTGMWSPTADTLAFSLGGAEYARLSSAGILLSGKTATDTSVVGCEINPVGAIGATRSASQAAVFNRLASEIGRASCRERVCQSV